MKGTLPDRVRLGVFEVDLRAGELRQGDGAVLVLPDQPLQILRMLIEADGEIVTREEICQRLWPNDTIVEFDTSINTAIKKLRRALVDSADEPHYIGTIAKRGYRLLVPVERVAIENSDEELPPAVSNDGLERPTPVVSGAGVAAQPALEGTAPATAAQPRAPSRWKWVVVFVCGAALAGTLYWRAHRAPKLTERDTVVLADFDNKTGDSVFDDTLKQALSIQLEQSPFLNVLSDDKTADTLKLMNRPAGERITREIGRELCLRSNSQALLEGTIAAIGNRYLVELKAANCQTGDTLASSEAEAEDRNHVLPALSTSANQLRQKLGESLASVQKFNQPLEQVTTSSLEALQAYTQGTKAENEAGGPAGVAHFKRAIDFDPNFAIAYAALGNAYAATYESSETTRYITKAYELRDRVTLRERFNIESMYYQTILGEIEKAIDTYQEWIRYYPNDDFPHVNLATDYNCLGQYDKGAVEARLAVQLQPGVDNYRNLVTSYMGMNRLDEAKDVIAEAEKRGIDGYPIRQWQYYLAFIQGDSVVMAQQDAWAKGKPLFEALQYTLSSSVEGYHGRFSKARELMQRAEETATRAGAKELVALMKVIHGPNEAEVGDPQIALSSVKAALPPKGTETSNVAPTAALTLALLGREAEARALADSIDKDSPHDTLAQTYTIPTIRAAIELGANRPWNAIKLLQPVGPHELGELPLPPNAVYPAYLRGLAYLKAGQAKEAAAEFQKVIDHPGITQLHLQGALAHVQLARAQTMMGDTAAARKSYEHFLILWKDADPDLPIYRQAKAEYAKLR
jgi:DNA-binding winged helix-turn-helix (wHTH) protein/tetratricopeptide (TPR) repeat protein